MLHDIKFYTQIKKNIFSWIQLNPVDPVSIWPEPDLKKMTESTGTGTGFPVAHCSHSLHDSLV